MIGSFLCGVLLAKYGRKIIIQVGLIAIVVTQIMMGIGFLSKSDTSTNTGPGIVIVVAMYIFMLAYSMCLGPLVSFYSA